MADPTAEVRVGGVWTTTLYINDPVNNKGTSERYCIGISAAGNDSVTLGYVMTAADAATRAQDLVTARARLLGAECIIAWARLSYTIYGKARGRRLFSGTVSQTARTGETTPSAANSVGDYVKIRLETPSGVHANRDIKGLRDSDVTASAFVPTVPPQYSGSPPVLVVPASTTDPMSAADQYTNFLLFLTSKTFRAHNSGFGAQIIVEPWKLYSFMSCGTKSMGPPFGTSRPRRRIRAVGRLFASKG